MWSGTIGYALDKSDYRIHKSPISPERVEGRKYFFSMQKYPKMELYGSSIYIGFAQTWPDTFKSTRKLLSKWGFYIIYFKNQWRYEIEFLHMGGNL